MHPKSSKFGSPSDDSPCSCQVSEYKAGIYASAPRRRSLFKWSAAGMDIVPGLQVLNNFWAVKIVKIIFHTSFSFSLPWFFLSFPMGFQFYRGFSNRFFQRPGDASHARWRIAPTAWQAI